MPELTADDARKIATALLKTAIETVSEEDGGARNQCKLCGASVPWAQTGDTIVHKPDCPVVVAQSVLARPRPHGV
ncbi:MAG: DUF3222 family protein [Rhodoplanes sp.]|uniref:DUF3222 family protein n=1 Tax=Rhodoplanes sp. TaxID=1968906 RepID=UPI001834BEBD|nr:DUF3222 family protein [Rhodoplanes sp.]NVO13775.1 DUF3222 family protein [Rhodoplanes sp.]